MYTIRMWPGVPRVHGSAVESCTVLPVLPEADGWGGTGLVGRGGLVGKLPFDNICRRRTHVGSVGIGRIGG